MQSTARGAGTDFMKPERSEHAYSSSDLLLLLEEPNPQGLKKNVLLAAGRGRGGGPGGSGQEGGWNYWKPVELSCVGAGEVFSSLLWIQLPSFSSTQGHLGIDNTHC